MLKGISNTPKTSLFNRGIDSPGFTMSLKDVGMVTTDIEVPGGNCIGSSLNKGIRIIPKLESVGKYPAAPSCTIAKLSTVVIKVVIG